MSDKTTEALIEELALSVARGFEETHARMQEGFAAVNGRLDRIEFHVTGQEQRIGVLEDRVRQLSTKVGLQFN
ncbi:MAG TPA: hypothetical protein VF624_00470 [Tepidisphaeraceae bacterium]|jgi:hypothetical protein